jgi:hypothetical protein
MPSGDAKEYASFLPKPYADTDVEHLLRSVDPAAAFRSAFRYFGKVTSGELSARDRSVWGHIVARPSSQQPLPRTMPSRPRPNGAASPTSVARTFPLSRSLLAQSGIEHMREPDAGFLQLLPDDRGVRHEIGSIDCHFAPWMIAGRTISNAVLRSRPFRDGEGLVCPGHRIRFIPALNSGRRDRFHQLGGGFIDVFSYGPEHKARIPSGMQTGVPSSG